MFSPLDQLFNDIKERGGFVNAHSHLDRAYSLTKQDIEAGFIYAPLESKWLLIDTIKSVLSEQDYENRMKLAITKQAEMGVSTCLSFIDIDPIVGSGFSIFSGCCVSRGCEAGEDSRSFISTDSPCSLLFSPPSSCGFSPKHGS